MRGLLHRAADCRVHVPCAVGDYTDFFAGINHATNAGKLFRPDNPLMPNYKYVPIGYHGRASSIVASGADVRRPNGQRKPANEAVPTFGPCRNLDYELELGVWIGPGNDLGASGRRSRRPPTTSPASACSTTGRRATSRAGSTSRSARSSARASARRISPWVVTPEAMAPFRLTQAARPDGDPAPLPYLLDANDQAHGALDIALEVYLLTPGLKAKGLPPHRLSAGSSRDLYWTVAQLVAHHTSNGCNLRPGDIFGTGTISGTGPGSLGSLLEISAGGRQQVELPSGESRRFLEDGDTVIMQARCQRDGFASIGFGECRGTIVPAAQYGA